MPGHKFILRADFQYLDDDNRIDRLDAEVLSEDGWQPLKIDNRTPGFLTFVYAFLICQHTYFHANSGESGLVLDRASAKLLLQTDDDWKIERIEVAIAAKLRNGSVAQSTVDYIRQRMSLCPVSINLLEPSEYQIEVEFS